MVVPDQWSSSVGDPFLSSKNWPQPRVLWWALLTALWLPRPIPHPFNLGVLSPKAGESQPITLAKPMAKSSLCFKGMGRSSQVVCRMFLVQQHDLHKHTPSTQFLLSFITS